MEKNRVRNEDSEPIKLKDVCYFLREKIEVLKRETKVLKTHDVFKSEAAEGEDRGEMIANIMLAYRHLEDARMRIGKVVQAYDGGESVYPK